MHAGHSLREQASGLAGEEQEQEQAPRGAHPHLDKALAVGAGGHQHAVDHAAFGVAQRGGRVLRRRGESTGGEGRRAAVLGWRARRAGGPRSRPAPLRGGAGRMPAACLRPGPAPAAASRPAAPAAAPHLFGVPLRHAGAVVRDGAGLANHDVVAWRCEGWQEGGQRARQGSPGRGRGLGRRAQHP